ncbi:MAG: hypothetical protein A2X86_10640 [Bdellovibrionales bacterium GWA2_49_15]|nr:MAG: hypothetical protein A2X86_10640 [Bdellovibrionales bacterium GWA2_49_15]HAZ11432.1 hypothetical protein [Bdellovibrionales bacterium]
MGTVRLFIIIGCLLNFPHAYAAGGDPNREHIDQIHTHYVYYDIKYSDKKFCDYKITNRDVMTRLWSRGVAFLKDFGAKIPAEPDYLIQPPYTQSANDEIRTAGQESASYYNEMEAHLRARHDSQDQALDNLLEEIEKTKGTQNLQQIRNLDPAAIVSLQLVKERFQLTSEQIQERLVYYDLLDEKVESTIDKMLQGYLDPAGQLPEGWVAPQNIQYMAVVELHLDNFRGLLHDTKTLTQFLSKCYGDLRETYLTTLVNTTPEIALEDRPAAIKSYSSTAYGTSRGSFIKPEIISLAGILDAGSLRYQDKLQKQSHQSDKAHHSLAGLRYQIAAHSKLANENGGVLVAREREQSATGPNTTAAASESATPKTAAGTATMPSAQQLNSDTLSLMKEAAIDSKKMLAEVKSEEHNRAMVIDLRGNNTRMNETEYQVYRRSRLDYARQEEDTIFVIISKAYHRVAFPIFLLPDLVEARQLKR